MAWLLLNPKQQFLSQGDSLKVNFLYSVCVMYVVTYSYNKSFPYAGLCRPISCSCHTINYSSNSFHFYDDDHLSDFNNRFVKQALILFLVTCMLNASSGIQVLRLKCQRKYKFVSMKLSLLSSTEG